MDFLNQALAQLRDLFASMTVGARLTAGLLLIIVVVSVAYLFNEQVGAPDGMLMNGESFSAAELPAMEAAFAKAGLSDYEIVGNRVRVPRGKQAAYMGALADAGALPPSFNSYMEKALEADSVFMSNKDKEMRLKIAKQNELALILRSMVGIENASVIYDVQRGSGLDRRETVTATVSVKPTGAQPLESARVPMIRNLVAGAIAGLAPQNVTVADLNGRTYPGGDQAAGGDPLEDPYYSRKSFYEKSLEQKIGDTLSYVPGVVVQVSAVLDKELRHVEETTEYDPKAVVQHQRERNTTSTNEGASVAGRPGLAAQGPSGGAAAVAVSRGSNSNSEDSDLETTSLVPTTIRQIERKTLTPDRVNVTVVVPSNYYLQVWNEQNRTADGAPAPKPEPKDLDNIKNIVGKDIQNAVVALLPPRPAGDSPFPQVTVTTFQSISVPQMAAPPMSAEAVAWLGQNWSTLGLGGLALVSLLMLRSMVKSVPNAPAPSPASVMEMPSLSLVAEDEPTTEAGTAGEERRLKRKLSKGPSLKDELADMVREDPDAAANILRNWISNAS